MSGCGGSGGAPQTGQFAGIYRVAYSRSESYATLIVSSNGTGEASAFADGVSYIGNCSVQPSGDYSCNLLPEISTDTTVTMYGRLRNQDQIKTGTVTMRMSDSPFLPGWSASGVATFKANSVGELFKGKYSGDMIGSIVGGRDSARLEVEIDQKGTLQGTIYYENFVYKGTAALNMLEETTIFFRSPDGSSDRVFIIEGELQYYNDKDKRIIGSFDLENIAHAGGSFQLFESQF